MARRKSETTRARGAPTRARIVAAAERLVAQRGFDGVTMPMIAAASGITAGASYKHFKGKAELFFEVLRRALEQGPMAAGPAGESLADTVAGYTAKGLKRF